MLLPAVQLLPLSRDQGMCWGWLGAGGCAGDVLGEGGGEGGGDYN